MEPDSQLAPVSKKARWAGHIMSGLPVLMLLFSAVVKFVQPPNMAEGFAHLGLPMSLALGLGILELACVIVYVIPQISVLGAILLTGYLGGATCTHRRVGDPWFSPIIVVVFIWGGLFLRDPRLRVLIPFRSKPTS